ncbi:glycoprotein 3-alpha-L-fucosyltransferase A [Hydra vulgaris]|uniref:glycoprotein 3-alpha-L-fucosyltransferase A n=1 Tax=Hydra vulgaris TaxID=6087 RepID=UPI000640D348|nr:glycoprotein 3-alpha-L-fucosyltransferase A [Hydra vulgaris]
MKRIYRRMLYFVVVVVLILVVWHQGSFKNDKYKKYYPNINFSSIITPHELFETSIVESKRESKVILLFTTHFYSKVWKGLDVLNGYTQRQKCKVKECVITYDKNAIKKADLVVFHGVDFTYKNFTSKHFQAISKLRPVNQRWVFWMHETPLYYPLLDDYDNLFNWTMTFSQHSDIYHPYFSYARLTNADRENMPENDFNYASYKQKKVVWMVSHCGMTRANYVAELQKYTDITVYGLCGADFDKMGGICSYNEKECELELRQYKFYLSFENSFCEDYVTEKYFKYGLQYGLLPIVMGAKYDDMNSISGSYIDVSKFSSIKELGDYINYLDSDDSAYNKYFEWKKHFKVTDGIDKICMLCHALHRKDQHEKTYKQFHSFWSVQNLCNPFEKVRNSLEQQIALSKLENKKITKSKNIDKN